LLLSAHRIAPPTAQVQKLKTKIETVRFVWPKGQLAISQNISPPGSQRQQTNKQTASTKMYNKKLQQVIVQKIDR